MKPKVLFTTWLTNDLTMCHIHMIDGKLVVLVPKTWELHTILDPISGKKTPSPAGNNTVIGEDGITRPGTKEWKGYRILSWDTIDLIDYIKANQ